MIADVHLEHERFDEAEAALKDALGRDPKNVVANLEYGRLQANRGFVLLFGAVIQNVGLGLEKTQLVLGRKDISLCRSGCAKHQTRA